MPCSVSEGDHGKKSPALNDLRTFSGLLIEFRERRGWTQEELAKEAAADQSYVSKLERGLREPSRTQVMLLATALGLDENDAGRLHVAAGYLPAGVPWVWFDGWVIRPKEKWNA
jgi:transcriptional regulator with XRE-family HTH domain